MPGFMGGASMANVCHGYVFGTCSGKTVKGSRDRVWSVWVEGSLVLCDGAFDGDSPVDVADVDQLVVTEILP